MRCIKTGFNGFCESHDLYLHGDAFVLPRLPGVSDVAKGAGYADDPVLALLCHDWLLLRISDEQQLIHDEDSYEDMPRHIQFSQPSHWFDRGKSASTIIVAPHEWSWLGYAGGNL